jgi:hypothetical protein|nr:MAG TPA: hypothetical protein [Caudoviricetes sp.]
MTEKEALIWIVGILGSACAAAITLDKVLDIIHKYIKKAQAPDDAQDKRLDELDRRVGVLETGYSNHSAALGRDLEHFGALENAITILLRSNRAVLGAQLSGDNIKAMEQSAEEIDKFLYERRENAWTHQQKS